MADFLTCIYIDINIFACSISESPDINPIENVWHELKEYIRGISKPKNKEELVQGKSSFWRTVTVEKCNRYINHLNQVIPKIIEVNGCASGY